MTITAVTCLLIVFPETLDGRVAVRAWTLTAATCLGRRRLVPVVAFRYLECFGVLLGLFLEALGVAWDVLGVHLVCSGGLLAPFLEPLGVAWGASWVLRWSFGRPGRPTGPSCFHVATQGRPQRAPLVAQECFFKTHVPHFRGFVFHSMFLLFLRSF